MIHESPNFRVEADDQVATLWLDFRGQAVNRFTPEVLADLDDALNALAARPGLDVLLLRSAKPAGFAADFDPHALARLGSAAELTELARRGQEVLARLEGLSPGLVTLALVEGPCLGAGLELALACDYRAAVAGPATEFAFPGVHAGLAPFWGGTVRLPRRVGTARALEMLLTGRALSAGQARDWGLVDFIFPERQLKVGLRSLLDRLQDAPRRPPAGRRGGLRRLLAENPLGRALALRAAARRLADVPAEDRPAGHAIVAALRAGLGCAAEGMARERAALAELAPTPACRNGLGLRRQAEQPLKIYPGPVNPVPLPPGTVGVVGGGDLGAALACWLALRGRTVVLQEPGDQALTRAGARLERLLAAAVAAGRVTADAAEQAGRAVRRTVTWQGFEECGWVIEAVEEDLGVKRGVLHELEERCRARVPLVSAASTVRVESLQAELQRPGRVAGMHFLAPVEENPIVELVRAPATDPDTLAALEAWARALGKVPVLVSDRPGRVVLRLLLAYFSEAVLLVSEGLPPEQIDRRMRRFGMARGPLEWIDAIGFDRVARLVGDMQHARGDRFAANLLLEPLRALGWQGRSNGEGFYRYRGRKPVPNELARMLMWQAFGDEDVVSHYIFDPDESLRDGEQRLVLRTVNEAAACLSEEQAAGPATIDLAMALGADWAPHRGGPLRYADGVGVAQVVEQLTRFAERFGQRFEPCVELQRRAEAGESFYGTAAPSADARPARAQPRLAG